MAETTLTPLQATAGIKAELAALREQTHVRDARTEPPDPNGWVLVFDQQSLGWVAMFESEQQQTWTDWWGLEHAIEDFPFWRPMPPAPEVKP